MKTAVGFALLLVLVQSASAQSPDRMRVTSASNVRLRAAPSTDAAIAGSLRLGTDLVELDLSPDAQWVRVRTTTEQEGWVSAPLTKAVPPGGRDRVLEEIAAEHSLGSFGFQAAIELVDLIEALQERINEPDRSARLALYRLKGLASAAQWTRRPEQHSTEMRAWLGARESLFRFFEPAGRYLLRFDAVMTEHDRYRSTSVAEEIAWFAVTEVGIGSDCETDLACVTRVRDQLEGEYLRLYPEGLRAVFALQRLQKTYVDVRSIQNDPRGFVSATDCAGIDRPLAALQRAVAGAQPPVYFATLKADVLRLLDQTGERCRKK